MKFNRLLLIFFSLLGRQEICDAQTVFSYGQNQVDKVEFMRAYSRNIAREEMSAESLKNYLDLYIKYKLKVQAARNAGYDALANMAVDRQRFREQMSPAFMNDEASLELLVKEVYERSKEEILLAHIFIAVDNDADSTLAAASEKARLAYGELQKGSDFSTVALRYSEDSSVKDNRGVIGYITALSLPYDLESAVYALAPNQYSEALRSASGYHIFKNSGQRPSSGQIQVAQILISVPPGSNEREINSLRHRSDSIYALLKAGADFKTMAAELSEDIYSYQDGGLLEPFGVGTYTPAFEQVAFALQDGEISKPLRTDYGFHIIRKINTIPVPAYPDELYVQKLRERIKRSPDRMAFARTALAKSLQEKIGIQKANFSEQEFLEASVSFLSGGYDSSEFSLKPHSPLFILANQNVRFSDWQELLELMSGTERVKNRSAIQSLYEEFIEDRIIEYYEENLEKLNPEFEQLMTDFEEGNLLFEIMQRKVWDIAMSDSTGLENFYRRNMKKYRWKPSADLILIAAESDSLLNSLRESIKENPSSWAYIGERYDGALRADSGRFEYSQLALTEGETIRVGQFVKVQSQEDGLFHLIFPVKTYSGGAQKTLAEARGIVISDYQQFLEDNWMEELKKQYPVKINQQTLKDILSSPER